jgi:hypothetical protein
MHRPILAYITLWFHWILAVVVLTLWKRATSPQRLIILVILLIAGSSVIELYLANIGQNNLWVMHFSTLFEFLLLSRVFYIWKKKARQKKVIFILALVVVVVWILSKVTIEQFDRYDSYTVGIVRIIEIIYAISLFFDILVDTHTIPWKDARVWIASGVIIYSSGVVLLFVVFNELLKISAPVLRSLWNINWILLILSSLMYLRGIMCKEPQENY